MIPGNDAIDSIFARIFVFAVLSRSRTGLAKSRKKWFSQYRCGTPRNSVATHLTKASCLSEIHSTTFKCSVRARSLVRTNRFLISAVVPESRGSANQTRLRVTSRTT